MNKKQAKDAAFSNDKTYGELLQMVKDTRGKRPLSKVNSSLTLDQALDIFEGAFKDKNTDDKPDTIRFSTGRLSGEGLGVQNVYWECG